MCDETFIFNNYERKIKSPFIIYGDFESIMVPEDNRKQNPDGSYSNKYQKNLACSYDYKLVSVYDKFNKPFKSYLREDDVFSFANSMIEERKCCDGIVKRRFSKELVMTKKNDEDFENSNKCWICDKANFNGDVEVKDHCHLGNIDALCIEIPMSALT